MMSTKLFTAPRGILPACILPVLADGVTIDIEGYRRHIADIGATPGVNGVVVNGHAAEVSSLTTDEQVDMVRHAVSATSKPIVASVCHETMSTALDIAHRCMEAGAAALLVFPPTVFTKGIAAKPEVVVDYFQAISVAANGLPLMIFQYPASTGAGYSIDLLVRLVESVPDIVGIKDGSDNPRFHELLVRTMHARTPPVSVFTANATWLLGALITGSAGILSGSGSVVARMHAELFAAVERDDLRGARQIADRLHHWTETIYRAPAFDNHTRMKAALVLLGKLGQGNVRAPLQPLVAAEILAIRQMLVDIGMLKAT